MRKHYRLLTVTPEVFGNWLAVLGQGIEPYVRAFNDKTILYRLDQSVLFHPTKGNTGVISKVSIDEPTLGLKNEEAFGLLRRYVAKTTDVIALFDDV
jgi:hypothetical protein